MQYLGAFHENERHLFLCVILINRYIDFLNVLY